MTVNFLSEKDSKDNKPLVTVGVICYNTGLYVTEALDSILEQTYKNYEVIILDDCSPDKNSVQIIEDYLNAKSLNFKFIKRNTNQGLAKNFLQIAALANPQSDYFCCIGDDIWHPNFLEESIRILEKSSESVIACFSDSKTLKYSTKEVIKNSIFKTKVFQIRCTKTS
jgi:teichuronic acid biosynthesis glycosyltransferase TuaG